LKRTFERTSEGIGRALKELGTFAKDLKNFWKGHCLWVNLCEPLLL